VKRVARSGWVFLVGILGHAYGGCSKPVESPKLAPAAAAVEDRKIASLRSTCESVLASIKANDAEMFIGYVSKDGVCFGIDCDPEPFDRMLKDLKSKSGFYCLLFDTTCERKIVRAMWKASNHTGDITTVLSFHDLLQSARLKKISYSPDGGAHVELEEPNRSVGSRPSFFDLGFVQEDGSWKLSDMEYP